MDGGISIIAILVSMVRGFTRFPGVSSASRWPTRGPSRPTGGKFCIVLDSATLVGSEVGSFA
jgi:hypothetical protein